MKECASLYKREKKWTKRIFSIWLRVSYPRVPSKSEVWMEGRFRKDMSLKPGYVGVECASYLRIQRNMIPYLIKVARKVKDRLRKQRGKISFKRSSVQSSEQSLRQSSMQSSM
jgi:hypothetical protein